MEAFLRCIHDGFRPQRFILGVNYSAPNPVALAKAQEEEQRQREDCKARNVPYHPDKNAPAIPDYTYTSVYKTLTVNQYTKMTYSMGPVFLETDPSYITPIANEIIKGPRLNPDASEDYEMSDVKRSAPVVTFVEDIDDMAYKRHHYRAAIPGSHADSDATQTAIYKRIREACLAADQLIAYHQEMGERADQSMGKRPRAVQSILLEYPEEMIADENQRLLQESKARAFDEVEANKKAILDLQQSAYRTMSKEEREKHGIPMPIVSGDFLSGGRYAKATSAELRKLKEESAVLQIKWEAKKGGTTLTQDQIDAIRSKAIIPVSAMALNAESTRASRRAKSRCIKRIDIRPSDNNKRARNDHAEVNQHLLHVPAIRYGSNQPLLMFREEPLMLDVDNTMSPVFENSSNSNNSNDAPIGLVAKGGILVRDKVPVAATTKKAAAAVTGPLPKKKPIVPISNSSAYKDPTKDFE